MNVNQAIAALAGENREIKRQLAQVLSEYKAFRQACEDAPKSITDEIDSIPGRRRFFNLVAEQAFDINLDGLQGPVMNFLVNQDGYFVMTQYPLAIWKPSAPSTATNFGQWSPVYSWPLSTQEHANGDRIDLSYEFRSGGSGRNFQNQTAPPLVSRPDAPLPLPVPTLFSPNDVIQFIPTYENILFDGAAATPTSGGTLVILLPGYRIVDM